MARKKLDLTYIENDSKRRATLKKRKSGLIKKVEEITTLCGIEASVIVYAPNEPQPEVWPSPSEARRVISKFREIPEPKQNKKMLDQEKFLMEKIEKAQKELTKVLDKFNLSELNDLSQSIDQDLKEINWKIDSIQGQEAITNGEATITEKEPQVQVMQNQPPHAENITNGGEGHEVEPFADAATI